MGQSTAGVHAVRADGAAPHPVAEQQPAWPDRQVLGHVRATLAGRPGLVTAEETARLRALLGEVAAGSLRVLQAGDCAEDPAHCTPDGVRGTLRLLDGLAAAMEDGTGRGVLRIGRMAGQFAKPRSHPVERVGGRELPAYRGPMVNAPEPDPSARRPDPRRLLRCYDLAATVHSSLAAQGRAPTPAGDASVYTSHEALLLDYEQPMLRELPDGAVLLASTHLPWIGERTRQPGGAHVGLLSRVVNPVACKVGPTTTEAELLTLCAALDPGRSPGRLTLVARMGAGRVRTALPPLVRAVRAAGHPVIWLCDPMHGNTVTAADGRKTRVVAELVDEVEAFQDVVLAERGVAGGLHLEATAREIAECVWSPDEAPAGPYTTLCDPRLNLPQAGHLARSWHA
ncbi:3-deoxy-7-phosphoheptulonate synthase [Streptomyces sp. NPDC087908]|uniref:3-deoxy-7-phosphoheptulonate synthase n=1 Tax=unclassified Streptomyces TaxID=2593676 RepID=UPI0011CEA9B1|nr:3-deoxy-7-phosphoheptulonate synthase [Streptomyces sp. adm13(2018)]TXS05268.1 phospho-2-dehydro-3-deoxyheptonate aldolase [Streptomyces sp. adm13(2018)]